MQTKSKNEKGLGERELLASRFPTFCFLIAPKKLILTKRLLIVCSQSNIQTRILNYITAAEPDLLVQVSELHTSKGSFNYVRLHFIKEHTIAQLQ